MQRKFKSRQDVADKIEWEGGIHKALQWGITADMMPDAELEQAWGLLVTSFKSFEVAENIVTELLPIATDEWEFD